MVHKVKCVSSVLSGLSIVDIKSDRQFPRHAHDQYGVGTMLDGGHSSWSGRGQVEAGPNDIITVSPNEIHDGTPIRSEPRRWRMLFVDPNVIAELSGTEMARREFPLPAFVNPDLAKEIDIGLSNLPDSTASEATEIVLGIFGALLDPSKTSASNSTPSRAIQIMLERIHSDLADAPTLAELAAVSSLTPYTVLRRFRRELATTPHAYILQYRVRMAHKAINNGATLAEAALLTGFADQSHMTRSFARQFGVTPGQWQSAQFSSRRIP